MTTDPEAAERNREIGQCRLDKQSKPKSATSSLQTRSKSSVPVKPRGKSATSAATPAKPSPKGPFSTGTGSSSAVDRLSRAGTPARVLGPGLLEPGTGTADFGRGAPGPRGTAGSTSGSSSSGSGTIDFGRGGPRAPGGLR
jgi:hypothetical protein